MKVGLIGAGNMASALARGFARPRDHAPELFVSDPDRVRAESLAEATGATVLGSNAAVRDAAELVVLCHKPAQLDAVADELGGAAPALVSILWGVSTSTLEAAYPDVPVYRFMPNVAAELGVGVLCYAPGTRASEGPGAEVIELFERAGSIVPLSEELIDAAGALSACGPAFFALAAEALAEAGERRGLDRAEAARLTGETLAGTAALLRESDYDTGALRTRVATPGGVTAKGLEALERRELRAAFEDAVTAVVDG